MLLLAGCFLPPAPHTAKTKKSSGCLLGPREEGEGEQGNRSAPKHQRAGAPGFMRDCFPSLGSRRVLPSEKEQHGVKLENTQQGKIAREEELRAEHPSSRRSSRGALSPLQISKPRTPTNAPRTPLARSVPLALALMEAAKAAFRTLGQADRAAFATFVTAESNPGAGVLEAGAGAIDLGGGWKSVAETRSLLDAPIFMTEESTRRLMLKRPPYGYEGETMRKVKRFMANATRPGVRRFATCAVVGSSGELRRRPLGAEIDSHSAVIRANAAPVGGSACWECRLGGAAARPVASWG